jgi:hypothetical protein
MLTVKASPEIGRTHGETVCVAGVRIDGDATRWIRLFPVPWEWFWRRGHPKYQVIELDVVKHDSDQRPESHRPMLDTVTVLDELKTAAKRSQILGQLPQHTMCDLVAAKGWQRPSLALVVPREVTGFDWADHSGDVGHATKMNRAAQGSLLAQDAPKLEFSPFSFRYHYLCASSTCRGHSQTIVDWEISEAWRRWRTDYPTDYLERIREKWLSLVDPVKLPAFYVGNQHQAPQGFLVLGVTRGITPLAPSPADRAPEDASPQSSGDTNTGPPQSTAVPLFDP